MTRSAYAAGLLLCALAAVVGAAEPSPIRLPAAPVAPPAPAPAPLPGGVVTLSGDALYVVDCKVEVVVRAHPAGLVRVVKEAGPITVRGRFVDGTGKTETRKFAGPHVYLIEAAGTGRVELDFIPLGLKAETEIVSATIDVDAGQGPIPPPKPKPDPEPKPPDPKPEPGPVRVLFIYETNKPVATEAYNAMYSQAVAKYLDQVCNRDAKGKPEWNWFDPNQKFAAGFNPTLRDLHSASLDEAKKVLTGDPAKGIKPSSAAVVVAVGSRATVHAVTNEADVLALLRKHAEGK